MSFEQFLKVVQLIFLSCGSKKTIPQGTGSECLKKVSGLAVHWPPLEKSKTVGFSGE